MIGDDHSCIQRIKASGVQGSSIIDLLAVGFSRTESDAVSGEEMARRMVTRYGGIRGLGEASTADISAMTGLDEFEVLRGEMPN